MWLWPLEELGFSILNHEGCHGIVEGMRGGLSMTSLSTWLCEYFPQVKDLLFIKETHLSLSTGKFLTYKIAHGILMF